MAEWLFEDGIGERRAALIESGHIIAMRIERDDDGIAAGSIASAQLLPVSGNALRIAQLDDGEEVILPSVPRGVTDGATLLIEVTRGALPERDLVKRAVARAAPVDLKPRTVRLIDMVNADDAPVRHLRSIDSDALEAAGWSEQCEAAQTGILPFPGGVLRLSPTPAMLVIDIDGEGRPYDLALAGMTAAARAITGMDIGGNIVVDLPTLADKAERVRIAEAFDAAMSGPFERTAINGYGLLQIIRPRRRISLIERMQYQGVASAALALLRRAERAQGTWAITITAHPRVAAWLEDRPPLIAELSRRTGRPATLQSDAARPMWGGDVH
jgi:hypothetical protein